jgi:hypothetical protein
MKDVSTAVDADGPKRDAQLIVSPASQPAKASGSGIERREVDNGWNGVREVGEGGGGGSPTPT